MPHFYTGELNDWMAAICLVEGVIAITITVVLLIKLGSKAKRRKYNRFSEK